MAEDLATRAGAVIAAAVPRARTPEVAAELRTVHERLDGPLRVAIAGKVKAGKSTLLNALLGEELAPTDAGECTKVVTWYVHGHAPRVRLHPVEGSVVDRPFVRRGALEIDLGSWTADRIDHLEVSWPTGRLRDLTILDTPGIASISGEISERTHRVMAAEDGRTPVADAVVYLLRHAHASDVRFLEAFHDDELAHGTPMNAIGVLSRADEIGSCRLDSLDVAERVARRYENDPRLRRLCPFVVPVDGLLAYTAATLRESEFALLARIAALPAGDAAQLLLSVDRFATREEPALELSADQRAHLLRRFGLFGVRLAVELIRSGQTPDAVELSGELTRRTGLVQLRSVLGKQFQERARVLKARSAISALEGVLDTDGCRDAPLLRGMLEQVLAGAHELEEVRVLSALRMGGLDLRGDSLDELDRLLGGRGHDAATRLGLPDGADDAEIRAAALTALGPWHSTAQHPLSSRSTQQAARTAIRTLEGLVAQRSVDG